MSVSLSISQCNIGVELVQELVRTTTVDLGSVKVFEDSFFRLGVLDQIFMGHFCFVVSLSIKVLGFDGGDSFWQAGVEEKHVTGERLVFLYFDDTANLDLILSHLPEGVFTTGAALN